MVDYTSRADDAIVEAEFFRCFLPSGLDAGDVVFAVDRLHFTPDKFYAYLLLDYVLQRETQRVEVARLHERTEDSCSFSLFIIIFCGVSSLSFSSISSS